MKYVELVSQYALDAIVVLNRAGNCIEYINRGFIKILGYQKESILGKDPIVLLEKSRALQEKEKIDKAIKLGLSFEKHLTLLRKNGEKIFTESHFFPHFNKEGKIEFWIGVFRPNEDSHNLKESLMQVSEQLSLIAQNAPLALWAIDLNGVFRFAMGKRVYIFDPTHEGLTDKNIFEVFKAYPLFLNSIRSSLQGELDRDICKINHYYFETYFSKLVSTQGENVGLIGVSFDVTERIRAEETRERLNSILETTTDLITLSDGHTLLYVNPPGEKLLGYTSNELIRLSQKEIYSQKEKNTIKKHFAKALKEGTCFSETVLKDKQGKMIPVSQVIIAHKDKAGKIKYFSTIARDIRKAKEYEKVLLEAKEKAELATQAKSEFLANMSHEIRTPLNSILGFSEMLLQSTKGKETVKFAQAISTSGKNLLRLISDILDLSKIESGKLEIELQPTCINEIVKEIYTLFHLQARNKKLEFSIKNNLHSNCLLIEPTRLRQVLFNLVGNAIKYTPKGKVCLICKEKLQKNGKVNLCFEVSDTGVGISKEDQKHIFDNFIQKNKEFGGAGLGLAITKKLTSMMGGKLSLKSQPGKGSIFKLVLPNIAATTSQSLGKKPKPSKQASKIHFKYGKILIADDHALNLELLKAFLHGTGVRIWEATNGNDVLLLAKRNKFDIILLDLRMPEPDGYKTLELLKKMKALPPVIAVTAYGFKEEEAAILKAGFSKVIRKPFSQERLIEVLKEYLPYESIEEKKKVEENMNASKQSKKCLEDNELLKLLEKGPLKALKSAIKTNILRDIKLFLESLNKIKTKYEHPRLNSYILELEEAIQNYDTLSISHQLNAFSKLLEALKTRIHSD